MDPDKDEFPIANGDVPASYVSLPEGIVNHVVAFMIKMLMFDMRNIWITTNIEQDQYESWYPGILSWPKYFTVRK